MKKDSLRHPLIIAFWLLLWQLTALFIHNPIYFAGPFETVRELFRQAATDTFWWSVAGSLFRILTGFLAAFMTACGLAFLSFLFPRFAEFLAPVISLFKSVPVAAVVVILLIWWGSDYLVLCISFMVILPNIYGNLLTGLQKTDPKLLEMAEVYRVPLRERFFWIYRPSYIPYLQTALSFSMGMGFKAGIAAEIIGLPGNSIGRQLYQDKIYLNTPGVFAWIVTILLLTTITEAILMFLQRRIASFPRPILLKVLPSAKPNGNAAESGAISPVRLTDVKKSYEDREVLYTDISLEAGEIYHLRGASGCGKTTLLHILAGLVEADGEKPSGLPPKERIRMVFQEDRVIMQANSLRNLCLAGCQGNPAQALKELLPAETLFEPVSQLSGGEKRRLCVIRAMLSPCDILLMDEPFTGLDRGSKEKLIRFISANRNGRTLLVVSHDEEDAELLGAHRLYLKERQICFTEGEKRETGC
ncbi:MAG: ATP-binding cassette domain-containing protein [Lachnospiraceae bacterium]|nr:ATP-binding cassette domain-containing protein [Lachnospiraceae bacterium]